MGYMQMEVELSGNRAVLLYGSNAKLWVGEGLPTYEGPIEGLPADIIAELLKLKAIK